MPNHTLGSTAPYTVGCCFASRAELSRAGVHGPRIAGIAGSGRSGARSVVLNGGYEDTEDFGDVILYTGHGGRDAETGRHCYLTLLRLVRFYGYSRCCTVPSRGLTLVVVRKAAQVVNLGRFCLKVNSLFLTSNDWQFLALIRDPSYHRD